MNSTKINQYFSNYCDFVFDNYVFQIDCKVLNDKPDKVVLFFVLIDAQDPIEMFVQMSTNIFCMVQMLWMTLCVDSIQRDNKKVCVRGVSSLWNDEVPSTVFVII